MQTWKKKKVGKFFDHHDRSLLVDLEYKERTEWTCTAEELIMSTVTIVLSSTRTHIGKEDVFYKDHISQSMKKESKLLKAMKSHHTVQNSNLGQFSAKLRK